ncbi:hypothetical protein [Streptomyces sp. NPDC003090]
MYGAFTGLTAAVTHLHINGGTLKETLLLVLPKKQTTTKKATPRTRKKAS